MPSDESDTENEGQWLRITLRASLLSASVLDRVLQTNRTNRMYVCMYLKEPAHVIAVVSESEIQSFHSWNLRQELMRQF